MAVTREVPAVNPQAHSAPPRPPSIAPRWLALACLAAAGCTNIQDRVEKLQPPRVELASLALTGMNLLQPVFRVGLRVENPNDEEFSVDGADAVLSLNGKPLARGVSTEPVTLKARGTTDVDIEATANTLGLAQQLFRLEQERRIAYAVDGHLTLAGWLGPLARLPFHAAGTLTRDELMREIEGLQRSR